MAGAVARTFEHAFRGDPAGIWAAMADTVRYNEAAGLPRHRIEEIVQPDGTMRFVGRGRIGPFELEWDDLPPNWVKERWFEHRRRFAQGPFRRVDARFELSPAAGGCLGRYTLEVEPATVAGRLLLGTGFFASAERMFEKLAADADTFALGERQRPFETAAPKLAEGGAGRLARLAAELEATLYAHGLAGRLAELLRTAPDSDVRRIRPLALARAWNVPATPAIELCLQATRLGLLELRWDLLCPRCRIAKATSPGLDRLPTGAHCGTCNIDYGRDFSRNVELSFRPAEAIREIEPGEFCLLGPMSMPHVWAHVTLAPGETRGLDAAPPPGPYRLRTLEAGPEAEIAHEGGPFPSVVVTDDGVAAGPAGAVGAVTLRNASAHRRTVVIESRAWVKDALTADRVAALQAFRDLFSDEVLRPGDEVAIRRVALIFSDLRGSTALYGAIGDAAAYHLVREHFAYLGGIVREHDGCIVKTIGDAVMAAFADPALAVKAAIAMQERVAELNRAELDREAPAPLVLKLGVHAGPCIAVTMNDRLDYFGSTVNLAARLQDQSKGGDLVISADLAAEPEIAPLLAGRALTRESAQLRGIPVPVAFVRVTFGVW